MDRKKRELIQHQKANRANYRLDRVAKSFQNPNIYNDQKLKKIAKAMKEDFGDIEDVVDKID